MAKNGESVRALISDMLRMGGPATAAHYLSTFPLSRSRLLKQAMRLLARGHQSVAEDLVQTVAGWSYDRRVQTFDARHALSAGLERGIDIYGLFRAEIGIGQSARRSARALRAAGIPISIHNVTDVASFDNSVAFDAAGNATTQFDTALIHLNADTFLDLLPAFGPNDLIGKRRIGYWAWELPVFPARWADAFTKLDEIWVPSSYVANSIRNATSLPVKVVPHAVESSVISKSDARQALQLPQSTFAFLTIFDSNSYPARKNPLAVLRAFQDAFPDRLARDFVLIVKCHGRGNRGPVFIELQERAAQDSRIIMIDEVYSETQIEALQSACDAYVSLHRAEGFGLNIIECMAKGKVAIATAFSGNMDYMTADNSFCIPYTPRLVEDGDYICGAGQWWAEPDHDGAVDAMRIVANNSSRADALAAQAKSDIQNNFSFINVGAIAASAWRQR